MGDETVKLQINEGQLKELQDRLKDFPDAMAKVLARAINSTNGKIRTEIVKRASKELGLTAKTIRSRVWVVKANRNTLFGKTTAAKIGWGLIHFGAVQGEKGVSTTLGINKGLIEHAFIQKMKSGHRGVFLRTGKDRLPIVELRSDSVTDAINRLAATPEIIALAQSTLDKRLEAETELILSGKRK